MSTFRILRNVVSSYARVGVSSLISFILTPVLFHYLQPQNYALLALSIAIVSVLYALDLGLGTALIRYVSDLAERGLDAEVRRLASSVFYLLLGVGIIVAAGVVALSPFLADFFHARDTASASGRAVIAVLGATAAFELPASGLRGFLEGCQDFHLSNAVQIAAQLLQAGATLLFWFLGLGLVPIAMLYPAAGLVRLLGMLVMGRWAKVPFWPRPTEFSLPSLRKIKSFALLSFVEDGFTYLFSLSDNFLAARWLPLPQLAILAVASRFPEGLSSLARQTLSVGFPVVSSAAARKDFPAMERFLFVTTRNLLASALPLGIALFAWADVVLRLWVGPEVLSAVWVFRIFLVFAVFVAFQDVPLTLLYGTGKIAFSASVSVALLASAVLVGSWACLRWGLSGLAIVFAALQATATVLYCWRAAAEARVGIQRWLKNSFRSPLLAGLPALAWFFVSYQHFPHTLLGLGVSVLLGLLIYYLLFIALVTGLRSQPWQDRLKKLLWEMD